jgi:transposase
VGKGSGNGTTRGDRRRNARRERLRGLLPRDGAVVGIDLAEDKQALAVVDHDVRVLARKTVKVNAFRLGEALDWAVAQARVKGFTQVAVACEPTGPRWLQVQQLCAGRGLPLVCIQPLMSHIAREQQDYTGHKTDEADCVLIGRLAVELHCYIPEELDETWACLRQLGRRRGQLITAASASAHRIRDFLSVAWPLVTEACAGPFESVTWLAAVQVVTSRCGADPARLAALGPGEFTAAVRSAMASWGGKRPTGRICRAVFAAQLSRLGDIPGLTAVGAAAILAETGDPRRYDSSSSLVKHAGLAPADNASGAFAGQAHISRRGRPGLRLAAWRAVRPLLQHNPVMAAKYAALTAATDAAAAAAGARTRQVSAAAAAARTRRARARVACAASLLRSTSSPCTAPAGTPWPPPASLPSQRPPDHSFHPARLRRGGPWAFLPVTGTASPPARRGPTPL